ncbi:MAG: hypothetical protein HZB91_04620 [Elusimicrobia bacterium]|nr:hypothetical protein [Elusimicrobiota bacterium]
MIPSPIHKVLLIFQNCSARFLLMGGQACILYGAAEFSRDLDLAIGIDEPNLGRIRDALNELRAESVFAPPLDAGALERGHACHFRCHTPETEGLRIDIMTRMRGCDDFAALWERRTMVHLPEIGEMGVLSLPDLIRAKKTQREKDWPMVRRLIEADILQAQDRATEKQVQFWFEECRTPSELMRLAKVWPALCRSVSTRRRLLAHALSGDGVALEKSLREEEASEKDRDRQYWSPLKMELEKWRHDRRP